MLCVFGIWYQAIARFETTYNSCGINPEKYRFYLGHRVVKKKNRTTVVRIGFGIFNVSAFQIMSLFSVCYVRMSFPALGYAISLFFFFSHYPVSRIFFSPLFFSLVSLYNCWNFFLKSFILCCRNCLEKFLLVFSLFSLSRRARKLDAKFQLMECFREYNEKNKEQA